MGDRVSISFRNGEDESVALFSHWGGIEFVETATNYIKELIKLSKENESRIQYPLYRLEPEIVMVDFIRHITPDKNARVITGLKLFADKNGSGDNSDNGHFVIDIDKIAELLK